MDREEQFARFDKMGLWQVRMITQQWTGPLQAFAFEWLRIKDAEERERDENYRKAQDETAQVAKRAAIIAAAASVIAAGIALLAWLFPIH